MKTHSDESHELIQGIRDQYVEEISKIETSRKQLVKQVYYQRTNELIRSIKQRIFIGDESLERTVDGVMQRIIQFNEIQNLPKRILIQKNPVPNAFCYGEGTFVITVGLLGNISNESELAFALAHEIAHYELDHVRNRILQQIESDHFKKTKRELERLLAGTADSEDVELLRSLVYGESRFNREMELKADSLGFIFFRNAGYNDWAALSLLTLLDSGQVDNSPVGPELFLPFHSSKYPFQEHWIRRRLSVYSKKYDNTLVFRNDSISSHPDISLRQKILNPFIENTNRPFNYLTEEEVNHVRTRAQFESVEGAYFLKQFDRCIHLSLRLMQSHPDDSYLVAMVSKVLIDLYRMKDTEFFHLYVPKYNGYYGLELRGVNDFLNNITKEEIGEIAYNFLNSELHFDETNEEHYYLLWRLCALTERKTLQKRIKQTYLAEFENGKFAAFMR